MPAEKVNGDFSRWKTTGLIATMVIVLSFPLYLIRVVITDAGAPVASGPFFVGRATCVECHKIENDLWLGSHHDMAMDTANTATVLGDFNNSEFVHKGVTHRFFKKDDRFFVNTQGPGGEMGDFEVSYTFGYTPLQQYLVPFEGGKLQCLPIAWDTERNLWFHLGDTIYSDEDLDPGNWLYWTNQAQNWNGMCADCHTTNLRKNFDPETGTFNTTWSEIDVSCEACHGPSSEHLEWAKLPEGSRPADVNTGLIVRTRDLDNRELLNVCARCHSRRSIMSDYENDNEDLLNYMIPQLILQPYYHADGQILDEDYVFASITQSKMWEKEVRCNDCHDSHSVKTILDDNRLCLQCHLPDIYDTPAHHFHKMPPEGGDHLINRVKPEYKDGTGSQCVNCHMMGQFYMGNDYRRDHSFRIPRPDLTLSLGTPNACNDCHTDKSVRWSQDYIEKWYGSRKRPHYGEAFAAASRMDKSAVPRLIEYAENELFPFMIRATAVSLLGNFDDSLSRAAVERAMSDPESLVRHSAINSYRPEDAESFEKIITPLVNDPVRGIRIEAAIRLSEVPDDMLSEPLRKARNSALEEYKMTNLYVADFPGGRYNLGIMYSNTGEIEKAAESYREALRIDGLFYMAKVNLAMVYARQGKNMEAELLLREVIEDNPDLNELYYSLALLLAENGKIEESRQFFREAADRMPDRPRIIYNLALFENSSGNIDLAESYLLRALEMEPGNYDFLYAITAFYLEHEKKPRALVYARQMAERFPGDATAMQLMQYAGQ